MKILTSIEEIIDPRMIGKVQHNLSTIIFVALCGILSGCDDWKDIRDYCRIKKDWLSRYICLNPSWNGFDVKYRFSADFRQIFKTLCLAL